MRDPIPVIDTADLVRRLADPFPPIVLDVSSEAEFRRRRIPGARRFGEHEVVLAAAGPAHPLVVTGRASRSLATSWAFRLLREMGFSDVVVHDDGLEGWSAAGLQLAGGTPGSPTSTTP